MASARNSELSLCLICIFLLQRDLFVKQTSKHLVSESLYPIWQSWLRLPQAFIILQVDEREGDSGGAEGRGKEDAQGNAMRAGSAPATEAQEL